MKGRTLVIGDIHGGLKALQQVLERAAVTAHDQLVFLGDFADGWGETAQLVDYLMALQAKQSCVFMVGNHDLWLIEWLEVGKAESLWLSNGGQATLDSYLLYSDSQKKEHLRFFSNMNGYWIQGEGLDQRLFLHAGFTSYHGPHKETFPSNFSWDRTLWETAIAVAEDMPRDHVYYPKRLRLFKEIFIGHTATTRYDKHVPMRAQNVWNLDTGAGFGGKLTLMDVETKQYWQSDIVRTLYPHEIGRIEGR